MTDIIKINEEQYLKPETLTAEEAEKVAAIAGKIDISDSVAVLQYGSETQRKVSDFSQNALANVRTKDMGEIGDMITSLITELKSIDENDSILGKLFKKTTNKVSVIKARYDKAEVSVEKITGMLEDHQVRLLKDVAIFDELYDKNLENFREMSLYIVAGKQKLDEIRSTVLPGLVARAQESRLPEDSQRARDMESFCDRFEKKVHDLELTRMVAIQMAPQIRLVQNNETLMAEKIQSTISNTIPLWHSQMVITLGIEHAAQATQAQQQISDMTNQLLLKNAEKLKMATIAAETEGERGIIDIETLQETNRQLIETLDEVVRINDEGHAKREAAELELAKLEGEIRQKLLDIREVR